MTDFIIPEIGENITSGTIVKILVKPGDPVKKDQDLIEMETDKATVPVPSLSDGTVREILVKKGDQVKIGQVVMRLETSGAQKAGTQKEVPQETIVQSPQTSESQKINTQTTEPPTEYDTKVAVIGAGPGGYAAAFLAADLGLDVTLIDKRANPGGVCLYEGCIPSKAFLHAAKVLSESHEAKDFGIDFGEPKIDIDRLRNWKNGIVKKLTGGLGQLSRQRKITLIQGTASFQDAHTATITGPDGQRQHLSFENAVIATGSVPVALPFAPQSARVLDSTSALELENVPSSLLLIGAGYIGLELGTVYAGLGSEVSVVEMMPGIIPGADRDLAAILERRLKTLFKEIMLSTKVTGISETPQGLNVGFETPDGKAFNRTYEKVLVAIGRKPVTKGLGLENTRVEIDEKGFIRNDAQLRTAEPNIFAIGDIAGNPMLAHKASHEGRVAVEVIAGHKAVFEPAAIPAVVFTDPEIAWAGLTETEAAAQGRGVKVVKFPWAASGRALTLNRTDGQTKLILDPQTERVLGVSIVGVGAGEMIAEGVLAVEMGALAEDIKLSIHPHPTLSETVMETAESFFGQSTHIYRPKK